MLRHEENITRLKRHIENIHALRASEEIHGETSIYLKAVHQRGFDVNVHARFFVGNACLQLAQWTGRWKQQPSFSKILADSSRTEREREPSSTAFYRPTS